VRAQPKTNSVHGALDGWGFSFLTRHTCSRPLPDSWPDARPVCHTLGEDFLRSPEIVAGIEQVVDFPTNGHAL
jgi:hypothetical protein